MRELLEHPVAGPAAKFVGASVAFYVAVATFLDATLATVLNGLVLGSLYGLIGVGIILIYRTNRIINFAAAGLGAVPGVLAAMLLVLKGWSWYVCFPIAVIGGAVLGGLIDIIIIRRFSNAPRLILTVATIGVVQILAFISLYIPIWLGSEGQIISLVPTPFDGWRFDVDVQTFSGNHVFTVFVVVAAVVALGAFLRFTRMGIALRASAENADRASLLGIPVRRVGTVSWVVAGTLASLVIFLRAPLVGVPSDGSLGPNVLLFALAAAVIARLDSIPTCLVAGIFVGVLGEATVSKAGSDSPASAMMLAVILVALLLQRGSISRALDTGVSTWQSVREFRPIPTELIGLRGVRDVRIGVGVALVAFLIAWPHLVSDSRIGFLHLVLIWGMVAVSMTILTGWAGQVSLGQFGFVGAGALVAGYLVTHHDADFFVVLLAAIAVGATSALLLGIPALRLPGLYLAVVTLAFAAAVQFFFLNSTYFVGSRLLPEGADRVEPPVLWERITLVDPDGIPGVAFYYVILVLLAVSVLAARAYRSNRAGRAIVAVRDNVRGAASYAVNPARTKLGAFAVSGAIAASAGVLLAYQTKAVDPADYGIGPSLTIFVMSAIGGLTSLPGAVLGVIFLKTIELFGNSVVSNLDLIVTGPGLLVILLFLPGGLAEGGFRIRDWWLRRVADANGIHVPSLVADRRLEEGGDGGLVAASADVVASAETSDAILVCEGVEVKYGQVQVLFGIDLEIDRGEIVALLGTNGAGKSTVLKAIAGLVDPVGGRITFDGTDITHLDPVSAAKAGIVVVPGGHAVFPTLTVADHFKVGTWLFADDDPADLQARIDDVLSRFPRLTERWNQMAGNLSGGEQQQLALGMAFLSRPRLLIIDELSLGLAPTIVEQLLEMVREIHATGCTIVLVEQSVNVALTIADRAYFLEKGEVRFQGPTAELLKRGDILRSVFLEGASSVHGNGDAADGDHGDIPTIEVLGESEAVVTHVEGDPDAPALEVVGLTRRFGGITAVDDVTFSLERGEILGLIGPNGAGKTTIFDLISGHLPLDGGRISLGGTDVTDLGADRRATRGLGRSFQDARIFPSMTVAENIAMGLERHVDVRDHLSSLLDLPAIQDSEASVAYTVDDLIDLMSLGAFRDKFVSELSTGSRRIVDLAMAIGHDPAVLLLDEPAAGVAQKETEALGPLLRRIQQETGCAMLVIEHDMPLITSVSDRIVALDLGAVVTIGVPDDVLNDPRVVESYLGGDIDVVKRSGAGEPATKRTKKNVKARR
ncbi:MAG TPA: ATP-binding cassette domain-containing protein [Acidimicrobiales bacterium]